MKIIALEEHVVIPELVGYGASTAATQAPAAWRNTVDTDYPFAGISVATQLLKDAPIGEQDKAKIAYQNVEKILHLKC